MNYMEACYEKNGTLDADARKYWMQLRERAGVSTDIDATIAATDLSKEKDFGVYSGTSMVDVTLYNIRRERMNELFSEGQRFADLIRWRSFDRMITAKWIPEGVNFGIIFICCMMLISRRTGHRMQLSLVKSKASIYVLTAVIWRVPTNCVMVITGMRHIICIR